MMKVIPYIIFPLLVLFFACSGGSDIADKTKRNNQWVWWVDAKTGKGSWIPREDKVDGVQNGKYTLFYFNGNIYEKGTLINGDKVDTTFFFDIDGNLTAYKTYANARIPIYFLHDGNYTLYYDDGTVKEKGVSVKHMPEGGLVGYYPNGTINYQYNLVGGSGWNTYYYENGKPRNLKYHRAGTRMDSDAAAKEWYPDGSLKIVSSVKNGEFDGIALSYYENGQMKDSGTWINGKRNGLLKYWYEDGHIQAINYYKGGKVNGRCSTYYRNGQLKTVAEVKEDKLNGEIQHFDESGKLTFTAYYDKGVRIN